MFNITRIALALSISTVALASPVPAHAASYIQFEGIEGESEDLSYDGWMDVLAIDNVVSTEKKAMRSTEKKAMRSTEKKAMRSTEKKAMRSTEKKAMDSNEKKAMGSLDLVDEAGILVFETPIDGSSFELAAAMLDARIFDEVLLSLGDEEDTVEARLFGAQVLSVELTDCDLSAEASLCEAQGTQIISVIYEGVETVEAR